MKQRLRVVAAALMDGSRVLLAERPAGKHMAGWWEFPGGKVSAGESDGAALVRELREELGIESRALEVIATMSHEYPDRIVDLILIEASILSGQPQGLDGQKLKWVECGNLGEERLLPADQPLIPKLVALSSRLA
jgi:8-oxo-dGTP diphosphatase